MSDSQAQAGTRVPRWTAPGSRDTGTGTFETTVPAPLEATLRTLAAASAVELPTLLLAAHLKVLSGISSEREVVTGYAQADPAGPDRCAAVVADGDWRDLIATADRARVAAVPGDGPLETVLDTVAVDPLRRGRGASPEAPRPRPGQPRGPAAAADLAVGEAVRAEYGHADGRLLLRLRYRRSVMDAGYAARLAGYHLAALELMCADPGAEHHRQSLLSDEELRVQRYELAGPRRPLPDELFVALFERQVRSRPDDVAAVHGTREWSYAELNARANRIAHTLLQGGLRPEDAVAVVMERNLDWLAAALAVFKAGGAYLPVRPDFPAERVATQLDRSGCRFAVSEAGSVTTLRAATDRLGRGCVTVLALDAYETQPRADDPAVPIGPGQLAYIYFTSGSTGAPKGAMCEHAGMLNHLFAKLDDARLGPGDAVTQTASQCFDISLWQLLAPLLAGGRTVIVDTAAQLDVGRFVDTVVDAGVEVIQIVPAYLDVLLTHLERHPRPLGRLRSVSVTGEALKLELVRRWFAVNPGITLVNAYGATEVSDDTMHEVLDGLPEREFVTVGRSLRNVGTVIVDEHLRPVPLGSPGEICFSGVCVGRGYVNDPERTRHAFVRDPFDPTVPMYRTGDFGRWLPEGKIEFLGRRDEQVKIRGFRIEIGEIENRLLRVPDLREAAVVIAGRSDQTKNLVAFFTGADALTPAEVRARLAASLPDYMVPAYVHRLDALPLTENGKVNKKRLGALADELSRERAGYAAPGTPTERRLATAWAEVLNVLVESIGRDDDFFRIGGTSLAAVRLVVKLDRLVSLRQLVARPVLRELATEIDAGGPAAVGDRAPSAALLQPLSTPDDEPIASLICFPYAGGNAINFQQLATDLAADRIAVYGVELPGHDVARADEPLAGVAEIAGRTAREVLDGVGGPVLIWGHCAGASYALETARLLEAAGREPARVFLGAMMLDSPAELRREMDEVSALDDREIIAHLRQDSAYVEIDWLKAERAEMVAAAYRHDVCSTNQHLIDVQEDPASHRLRASLDVVVAGDDPATAEPRRRGPSWGALADGVTVHELAEGGHYFIRTKPADVAALVRAARPVPAASPA
jgi:amino acid adenylation domain-containing protein